MDCWQQQTFDRAERFWLEPPEEPEFTAEEQEDRLADWADLEGDAMREGAVIG